MTVAPLLAPEKALHTIVFDLPNVRYDGSAVERRNPVVDAVDKQESAGIPCAIGSTAQQSAPPKTKTLIDIQKGIMQKSKPSEVVVYAGDGCLHGAVDTADAYGGIGAALGENAAHGIAAHAVAEQT